MARQKGILILNNPTNNVSFILQGQHNIPQLNSPHLVSGGDTLLIQDNDNRIRYFDIYVDGVLKQANVVRNVISTYKLTTDTLTQCSINKTPITIGAQYNIVDGDEIEASYSTAGQFKVHAKISVNNTVVATEEQSVTLAYANSNLNIAGSTYGGSTYGKGSAAVKINFSATYSYQNTFDLKTLQLEPDHEYSISVVAKASGYRDSDTSNSIIYTPTSSTIVTFNVIGTSGTCDAYDGTSTSGIHLFSSSGSSLSESYPITSGNVYLVAGAYIYGGGVQVTGGASIISGGKEFDTTCLLSISSNATINIEPACIAEGTLIILADRTQKPIEDITYNDNLLVWNFDDGKFDTAKPAWIKQVEESDSYLKMNFDNGSELKLIGPGGDIGYHRIYNNEAKAFTHCGVDDTPIGTHTFTDNGTYTELISQEVINEPVKFYNIITDNHYNIFANNILTSCRLSNKYDIEDMKYIGEQKISDEEISNYFTRIESLKA